MGVNQATQVEERAPAGLPPAGSPGPAAVSGRSLPVTAALAGAVATAVLVLTDASTPLRPLVVLAFLVAGPGVGVAQLLSGADAAARLAVSLGSSLAIVALAAEAMLLLDAWSPTTGLAAVLTLFGLGVGLARWRTRHHPPGGRSPTGQAAPSPTHGPPTTTQAMSSAGRVAPSPRRVRWRTTRRGIVADHLPFVLGALVCWAVALSTLDLRRVGDYGLVPVLPVSYYAALVALVASFAIAVVRRRTPTWLLTLHVVALIVLVHGTLAVAYDAPRYAWVYKHVGVVDHIIQHGQVDRSVDVYHNWPGMFALAALATELAGGTSPLPLVAWAQLGFGLLNLAALVFVFRSLALDRRLVWVGAWIFFAANWVGQEYFSPQALTFFLSLVLLGVCLRWLRAGPGDPRPAGDPGRERLAGLVHRGRRLIRRAGQGLSAAPPVTREERAVATGIVLVLFAAIATSHQLTPWVVVATVTVLAALRRCRPRALPAVLALLAVGWVWLAYPYLVNLDVFGDFGRLAGNGQVVDLANQSEGRVFVATVARALTAAVWLLAVVGGIRHWRSGRRRGGHWGRVVAALALVPFSTVVAQSYGGEILFRAYLFSLPWTAFLAAGAFFPHRGAGRRPVPAARTAAALTAAGGLLVGGLLVAYFGLERANHIRSGEVAAARRFYQVARPGSFLMLVASNFPTRLDASYPRHPGFSYDPSLLALPRFQDRMLGPADVPAVVRELSSYPDAYLMVSTSQAAHAELFDLAPPGAVDRLKRALLASPRFRVVYRNDDATLFRLRR
jgi:hypothetical protein